MYYVCKRMEIAGCHRLELSYPSKCSQLHGHNWIVTVYCKARELNADGMVCDFTHIKERIHTFLDHGNSHELPYRKAKGTQLSTYAPEKIMPPCKNRNLKRLINHQSVYENQRNLLFAPGRRSFHRDGRHICEVFRL